MAGRQPVVIRGEPPPAVMAFGAGVEERRRDRRGRVWAATVEIRGDSFAGRILDFAPAPRQLDFGAPVGGRDALPELLLRLDRLGAPLLWRRDRDDGAQLLFAPRELAARLRGVLPPLVDRSEETVPELPRRRWAPGRGRRLGLAAAGSSLAVVSVAVMLSFHSDGATGRGEGDATAPLAVMAGAADQHSCPQLLGRVTGATNQIDFSLHVAAAAQAKCLDLQHGGVTEPEGHIVQATKLPLR